MIEDPIAKIGAALAALQVARRNPVVKEIRMHPVDIDELKVHFEEREMIPVGTPFMNPIVLGIPLVPDPDRPIGYPEIVWV